MFRILIFLFLPMMAFSQELSFSVAPKSRIVNYNEDLKSAIDSKKIAVFETYLTNNKKKMDDAVEKINSGKAVVLKPALHYVLEKCISGELDPIWLETYIKKGADIHVDYNGKSILYRLLDNIATTPKTNVKSEVESLKIIYASSKLGIDQNYKSFLQPFSYLLRENYDFLGGKYSADYIPKEVIQFFVDKGANVESYDKVGNGLMTFATQTNQKDIMDYLTSKGINVSKANSDGKDPMYFAIQNNDFAGVEKLIASNYKVIPSLFSKLNLKDISEEKIRNLLANSTLENLVTGDDLLLYVEYFPLGCKENFPK